MTLPLLGVGPAGGDPVPSVVSTASGYNAFITSHIAPMPATVNAGNTLLMIAIMGTASTFSTPAGWTLVHSLISSQPRIYIFKKTAVGNEDGTNVTVTAAGNSNSCIHTYALDLPDGVIETPVSTNSPASTASTITPPSISGLGTDSYIFIPITAQGRNDNVCTGPTSGYNDFVSQESSGPGVNSTSGNNVTSGVCWIYEAGVTGHTPAAHDWSGNMTGGDLGAIIACR